jgi:uncharacterized protein
VSHLRLRLLTAAAALIALSFSGGANAASSELFFSEYIEGSSNNKALEIYNGTGAAVDLAAGGYSVQMFFNGSVSPGLTINLTGTVAAGDVHVVANSAASATILAQADQTNGSGWFNGDDAIVLRKGGVGGTIVDSIGQIGFDPGTEWGTGLVSTADNTLRRKLSVSAGDTTADDVFDPAPGWDGFASDSFDGLGGHGGVAGVTLSCGGPLTHLAGATATRTISATDADGRVTGIQIDSITPSASPGSITLGSVTPALVFGGTASATLTATGLAVGTYTVAFSASNNDIPIAQVGTCTLQVVASAIRPIGEVQGPVGSTANGQTHVTPLLGKRVYVQGVIYEKTLSRSAAGVPSRGFFIQNTASQADGDSTTSDGLFVFMGNNTSLIGGYVPQVGDSVVLSGTASEFFNLTQLTSASLERFDGTALDIDVVLPPVEVSPPNLLVEANRYWERLEDMRVAVPAGSLVTDGLDSFPGTADSEMWVIRGDHEVAVRTDPFTNRVFRDAHPLDNLPGLFDDGNGYRILVGPNGLKAAATDTEVVLPPSRTFAKVSNTLVGGLNYSFSKYRIETTVTPALVNGIDPSLNAPPTASNRHVEYSVGDFNVENLYDYRDDPNDGCDFTGNSGCPGVNPPFDYVPASDAVYQQRLGQIAQQVVGDVHAPDILLVQEAEDQDICKVVAGALSCGAADNADGKPDTLQELALRISAQGGPTYQAVYDRDGSDDRGIVAALMYRTDRVELLPATADHPVLGNSPEVEYRVAGNAYNNQVQNPKALNAPLPAEIASLPSNQRDGLQVYTRDPQVGFFRVWRTAVGVGAWTDEYPGRAREAAHRAGHVPRCDRRSPRRRRARGGRRRLQRLSGAGRPVPDAEREQPARRSLRIRADKPLGRPRRGGAAGGVLVRVRRPGADARWPVRDAEPRGRAERDSGGARQR